MRKKSRLKNSGFKVTGALPLLTLLTAGVLTIYFLSYEKSWSYNWEGFSQEQRDSVIAMQHDNITLNDVGYNGRIPRNITRKLWFRKHLSDAKLLKLTHYPSGTIRANAYRNLLFRQNVKNKSQVLLNAINDHEYTVQFNMGCVGETISIGEYLMEHALSYYFYTGESPFPNQTTPFGLSEKEIESIHTAYKQSNEQR